MSTTAATHQEAAAAAAQQQQQQQQQPAASPAPLDQLPAEMLIEIFSHTDFETFENLRMTNRRLRSVIDLHWPRILPFVIARSFRPADEFWDTFSIAAVEVPDSGDGLPPLLAFCRVIKRWEAEFPRLRFARGAPEDSRTLKTHEVVRLRRALYFWWRFARAFHTAGGHAVSDDDDDNDGNDDNCNPGARRDFVRGFSTARFHETKDLWATVRWAVRTRVCPSVSLVRGPPGGKMLTKEEGARVGWGDAHENSDIVDTLMKLPPDDMLHLLVHRHRYATKSSVVDFVRFRHPRIEESAETFSRAVFCVLRERNLGPTGPFLCAGFPEVHGGVLDHERFTGEKMRGLFDGDAGVGNPSLAGFSLVHGPGRLEPSG